MPGGFVPYHHSTGKKYKNPGYTSGGSKSGGTGTGSATYGSPSNPYVPSGSSSSTSYSGSSSSSSSSSAAAAKAVAQAQAAVKAAKAVVSEYGKDKKNPKSVSGKYAKATEKAKKKREKTKVRVERKTREVKAKYDATPRKLTKTPKFGPGNAYTVWEGSNKIASKARELAGGSRPLKPTGTRQKPSTTLSGPKPRKVANRLEKAVSRAKPVFSGLDSEQSKVLRTVLNQGVKAGADRKTLLSAVETGLVESGLRNLSYGDADSQGWRQERSMYYPNPTNVKASAKRYFQEAAEARAPGQTAGNLAQAAQQSAFPERYDAVAGQAKPLLKEFTSTRKEAVPKPLKRTARQTLGKKPTKAILRGGKVIKDKNAGEEESGAPPYKETKQYIVPTEARSEIRAEQRAPAKTMVTGMDPALQAALVQLAKNTGIPVQINEGYRTEARANDFPSGTASQHHQGNAADTDNNADYSAEDLAKVGLNNTAVGGEPWHFQLNNPDATASTVNTNIPIKGTNLAVKVPTPTSTSGATGTTTSGGTTSTGAPVPGTPEYQQMMNEVRRRRGPSVAKRLAAIDRWMTSPVTAPTPEISQELIDRILGK